MGSITFQGKTYVSVLKVNSGGKTTQRLGKHRYLYKCGT